MARLPIPGKDAGTWGDVLNDYLSQVHAADGTLKQNAVTTSAIAPDAITAAEIQNDTITTAKLHDDAVTDAKITDGTITEAKLATSVQTKLNQAVPTWSTLSGKPAVVAAGADQAAARSAIGAGTSNLTLGTTGSTATAGDDSRLSDTRTPTDSTVTTAKIVDGNVTEAKLSTAVQAKLNSAGDWDTLDNKPAIIAAGADQLAARAVIGAPSAADVEAAIADAAPEAATTAVAGLIEIATSAEALAGTDTVRAITSATLADARRFPLGTTIGSGTRNLTTSDYGKMLVGTSASAATVVVPLNATAALPVETEIMLVRAGSGAVTVSAEGGVAVVCALSPSLRAIGSVATLKKIDSDIWILMGDLTSSVEITTWLPTLSGTSWSRGSGGRSGAYQVVGGYCTFHAFVELGTGATFGNGTSAMHLNLPVAAHAEIIGASKQPLFATYTDTGSTQYQGRGRIDSATDVVLRFFDPATGGGANVVATTPFTWAEGDYVFLTGTYRVAA